MVGYSFDVLKITTLRVYGKALKKFEDEQLQTLMDENPCQIQLNNLYGLQRAIADKRPEWKNRHITKLVLNMTPCQISCQKFP